MWCYIQYPWGQRPTAWFLHCSCSFVGRGTLLLEDNLCQAETFTLASQCRKIYCIHVHMICFMFILWLEYDVSFGVCVYHILSLAGYWYLYVIFSIGIVIVVVVIVVVFFLPRSIGPEAPFSGPVAKSGLIGKKKWICRNTRGHDVWFGSNM